MSCTPPQTARARLPGFVRVGVIAVALTAGMPAVAQAAPRVARVCVQHVVLVESPGGAATGIVHHDELLRVLDGAAHAKWWRVVTSFGTRGWLRQRVLCGRDR